jgi:hypothetical protein
MIRATISACLLAAVAACGGQSATEGEACAVSVPAAGTVPCDNMHSHPPPVDCHANPEACRLA